VIASFGDSATEAVYHGGPVRLIRRFPPGALRVAVRKLDMLNAARALRDLQSPPGNRLEALRGVLTGFHSIRVNDQWRIVFRWTGTDAYEVRLTDYH
jgi:proteic killer suppression protein